MAPLTASPRSPSPLARASWGSWGRQQADTNAAPGLAYQEAITINADTGIPLGFVGGNGKATVTTTITYVVTRVNLADIAAGKF